MVFACIRTSERTHCSRTTAAVSICPAATKASATSGLPRPSTAANSAAAHARCSGCAPVRSILSMWPTSMPFAGGKCVEEAVTRGGAKGWDVGTQRSGAAAGSWDAGAEDSDAGAASCDAGEGGSDTWTTAGLDAGTIAVDFAAVAFSLTGAQARGDGAWYITDCMAL